MDNSEIHEIVTDISLNSSHEKQDDINALTISMLEMDEIKFNKLYELHVAKSGLLLTVTDLFYPFLNHVGVLWGTNKLLPAQEHFTTNLIRQKLISAIDQLPATPPAAPKIVFFLLEGENHEIALLLAAFIAKNLGWHIYYLGQNVPATDISTIISSILPNIMMTMFIAPRPDEFGHYINSIIKDNDVPLLFSGNPDNLDISIVDNRITFIASPKKFISFLKKI